MNRINYITSDLLVAPAEYIVHQVNCQGVMGAGLALTLRNHNSRLYSLYRAHCRNSTPAKLLGKAFICDNIISIFGQLNYGRNHAYVYTDYTALDRAFRAVHNRLPITKSIAFPYGFGCGLANGDWNTVKQLITDCFPGRTVYICKK